MRNVFRFRLTVSDIKRRTRTGCVDGSDILKSRSQDYVRLFDDETHEITSWVKRKGERYSDFVGVIEEPVVDAVVSVTPNNVHAEVVRACLKARKPSMVERPVTSVFGNLVLCV